MRKAERLILPVQRANARLHLHLIGQPPTGLSPEQLRAWHDVVAASPVRPTTADIWLELVARMLAHHRSGASSLADVRELYRWLGLGLVPMAVRRALLFPDRA